MHPWTKAGEFPMLQWTTNIPFFCHCLDAGRLKTLFATGSTQSPICVALWQQKPSNSYSPPGKKAHFWCEKPWINMLCCVLFNWEKKGQKKKHRGSTKMLNGFPLPWKRNRHFFWYGERKPCLVCIIVSLGLAKTDTDPLKNGGK